ncbi:MAG: lipid IV(A) 3-deoxy-D-manno-octulosonic acid transferase [Gammaproteobacteria bacterium]|nr:lipid IV(A) 3-deoxy-D-manno-octulosonic acid transferase [Gammaproteobacteria bacterium]
MWWRSFKDSRYRQRWLERLAFYPAGNFDNSKPVIVFHAVSVGELHAAVPLIHACQQALPEWTFTVTTTTVTGSARVKEIFSDSVQHCYMPYDSPGSVKRFLRAVKPKILVILETELWPNLLFYCHQQKCKLLLLNARLSPKSFLNYQKYAGLTSAMLKSLDVVAAQFEQDAKHFRVLGTPENVLHITGTMKFDQEVDQEQLTAGLAMNQELQRPILVAGSTREGEEEKVLAAFRVLLKSLPELLLILIPRHPDRFKKVANLLSDQGYIFVQRSSQEKVSADKQILLGDSLGEMQFYYASADLAFVGGSLVNTGCQNIIEPAVLGLPIVTGPSLFNFKAVSDLLINSGAMQLATNEQEFAEKTLVILQDKNLRQNMADAAGATVAENRGATEKQKQLILQAIHSDQ